MSLENKHFIIKQEVSLSQDFSEPLLKCMFIRLSKRKKQDSDFSSSSYHISLSLFLLLFFFNHKSLYREASHGTYASQDTFWNWKNGFTQ